MIVFCTPPPLITLPSCHVPPHVSILNPPWLLCRLLSCRLRVCLPSSHPHCCLTTCQCLHLPFTSHFPQLVVLLPLAVPTPHIHQQSSLTPHLDVTVNASPICKAQNDAAKGCRQRRPTADIGRGWSGHRASPTIRLLALCLWRGVVLTWLVYLPVLLILAVMQDGMMEGMVGMGVCVCVVCEGGRVL
jgi:hypothetical protein